MQKRRVRKDEGTGDFRLQIEDFRLEIAMCPHPHSLSRRERGKEQCFGTSYLTMIKQQGIATLKTSEVSETSEVSAPLQERGGARQQGIVAPQDLRGLRGVLPKQSVGN